MRLIVGAFRGVKLDRGMEIVEWVYKRRIREVVEVNEMQFDRVPR